MALEVLPEAFGFEIKQVAWRSAWWASNEAISFDDDAAKDKEAVEAHCARAKELGVLSEGVLGDVRLLCFQAAWHAAYERIEGRAEAAQQAKQEFEALSAAVAASGEVCAWLAEELKWMGWNAAWHAANARMGCVGDAKMDLAAFEGHYRRCVGRAFRGVSLGGWLLLERWQCDTMFADFSESDAPDEFSLCTLLGPDEAVRRLEEWRSSWIVRDDFARIRDSGFNSVRLPFGFWVLDGVQEAGVGIGPFVPGVKHIDNAVQWAEECGLKIILDLHSVPGFQSGHHATGRQNPSWRPSDWDVGASLKVIGLLAARYQGRPSVAGIGVINEPDNAIGAPQLVGYYRAAHDIIRGAGHAAEEVDIFFPAYQRDLYEFGTLGFPDAGMAGAALEIHSYQCFGSSWTGLTLEQHLARAADGKGHWPGLMDVYFGGVLGVVGEWSLRLPDWDPSFRMYREWASLSPEQRDAALAMFAQRQVRDPCPNPALIACARLGPEQRDDAMFAKRQIGQFGFGIGWFFWNWKVDNPGEPWWSAEECLARGWISKAWLTPEGCGPVRCQQRLS